MVWIRKLELHQYDNIYTARATELKVIFVWHKTQKLKGADYVQPEDQVYIELSVPAIVTRCKACHRHST